MSDKDTIKLSLEVDREPAQNLTALDGQFCSVCHGEKEVGGTFCHHCGGSGVEPARQ